MKRKIGLTATPMPKNWVRALYIISKRKLRKVDPNVIIGLVAVIVLLLQVFIIVTAVNAQQKPKGLQIGDKVPDVTITNIINSSAPAVKISDFKGKLLILDFWATWCSPCVSMLPKMEKLKDEFGEKVVFMPVTYQSEKEISGFIKKIKDQMGITVSTATSNKELAMLFPHRELPHYVWIDGNGIVQAITSHDAVTSQNINAMLLKAKPVLALKKESKVLYEKSAPLLIGGNGGNGDNLKYHSLYAGYTDGLPARSEVSVDKIGNTRITATNTSIVNLYRLAFSGQTTEFIPANRRVVEVKNQEPLVWTAASTGYKDWKMQYGGSYELIVPPGLKEKAFEIMKADLERLFPQYEATVEKRRVNALVLKRTSTEDKLKSADDKPHLQYDPFGFSMKNKTLNNFLVQLAVIYLQKSPYPIVDRTGYSGKADLTISASMSDVTSINKALAQYDLQLIQEETEIDMLVIRDSQTK